MDKHYQTALFTDKTTGKLLYRLHVKPLNKYFWEKEKLMVLEKIVKDRFYTKEEVEIKEIV